MQALVFGYISKFIVLVNFAFVLFSNNNNNYEVRFLNIYIWYNKYANTILFDRLTVLRYVLVSYNENVIDNNILVKVPSVK